MLTAKEFAGLRTQRQGRGSTSAIVGDTFTTKVSVDDDVAVAEWQNLGTTVLKILGDGSVVYKRRSSVPATLVAGQLWLEDVTGQTRLKYKSVDGSIVTLGGPVALNNVYVVADQPARLALTAVVGDVAKQLDTGESFILQSTPASTNSNWIVVSDTTPDWSIITNKPTTISGYGIADGVSTGGSYANPVWITSLAFSKLTSTPTTIAGYGIADGVSTSGSYANPSWLTSLAFSKLTSTPTTLAGYGIADAQPLNTLLTSLSGLGAGNGLVAQNGSGFIRRQVLGTSGQITVTGGDGTADITVALPSSITQSTTFTTGLSLQTAATAAFKVYGAVASQAYVSIGVSDTRRFAFVRDASDNLLLYKDMTGVAGTAATLATVSATGNLGWGTAPSAYLVDIGGTAHIAGLLANRPSTSATPSSYISTNRSDSILDITAGSGETHRSLSIYGQSTQGYILEIFGNVNIASNPALQVKGDSTVVATRFQLPHTTAPSTPADGEVWTTTAGLYTRINGTTVGPLGTGGGGGGMTNPMSTLGDLIYGGASGTPTRLAGNATTAKRFLTQTGSGAVSAAPAWNGISPSDLGTGTPSGSTYLRGDGVWTTIGTDFVLDLFTAGTNFTGGVTTALTLSTTPGIAANAVVTFDGLTQHSDQYSVSGTTITFTAAIPVGTLQVQVRSGTAVNSSTSITAAGATTARSLAIRFAEKITPKDFGAVGDGTTDDTAAFIALQAYVRSKSSADLAGGSNNTVFTRVEIPAGTYLITQAKAFWNDSSSVRKQGLVFVGDGFGTVIKYRPTVSGPLIRNNDELLGMRFQYMRFDCNDAASDFMESISSGGAQDVGFNDVQWSGQWRYGVYLSGGTNNNSEFRWQNCDIYGGWTYYLFGNADDQNVNHWFINTKFWPTLGGGWIRMVKGGNIRIIACDVSGYAPSSSTYLFSLETGAHAGGVASFYCNARFELKNTNAKVMYCEWDFGQVSFFGSDESSQASLVSSFETHKYVSLGSTTGANVVFFNCSLMGTHRYETGSNGYTVSHRAAYYSCNLLQISDLSSFVTLYTPVNTGGKWQVRMNECLAALASPSSYEVLDGCLGWTDHSRGTAQKRSISVRDSNGKTPWSGASLQTKLPLGAIVTSIRMYLAAGASGSTSPFNYQFKTAETTPTVLATASGAALSSGFDVTQNLFFVCDTLDKRTINLVDIQNIAFFTGAAYMIIEYTA